MIAESLPSRGAWIEISVVIKIPLNDSGRSPHGERGLKYVLAHLAVHANGVAPLTGSVD